MSKGRVGARLLVLAALAAALAAPASAGAADGLDAGCQYTYEQPFVPWLDFASYVLVPNGDLESGRADWGLDGEASVVADNESFYVHDAGDGRSLSLPSGSSATTGGICIGATSLDLRFFARSSGSPLSTLKVEVLYTDLLGRSRAATVAMLTGSSSWQPTLPVAVVANLTLTTSIGFRFTPQGSSSEWRIDDVYVDPFKGE
ncbi:MAG TPA: hypothetical protein VE596_02425 [Gaiellaceae bacterium]|jgi:hypothetical protein|nr:hypothetical protein [Gaiellaceae bacterium]